MSDQTDRALLLLRELAHVRDEQLSALIRGEAAHLVADAIVASPTAAASRPPRARARRRRIHLTVGMAAAAAVAVAAVAFGGWLGSSPAAAGVRFHVKGGYIVARVTDPQVTAKQLRAAFQQE